MKATFVELVAFRMRRQNYLSDEGYQGLQNLLMQHPEAGDLIKGTGGLRKLRFADERRGKGKRGGLRIIYFWWGQGSQFWLFTLYDKDEAADLSATMKDKLRQVLVEELQVRK